MVSIQKRTERAARSRAYRQLVRGAARDSVFSAASSIFDCLTSARTNENCARSAELLRDKAAKEGAQLPVELSLITIAQYYVKAARLYASAGAKCICSSDRSRPYTYYRRASRCMRRAVALQAPGGGEFCNEAKEYAARTAIFRQAHARQSICRRRMSLGLLRRTR
jgi:hypothetical protein